jgi:hypothetical protein
MRRPFSAPFWTTLHSRRTLRRRWQLALGGLDPAVGAGEVAVVSVVVSVWVEDVAIDRVPAAVPPGPSRRGLEDGLTETLVDLLYTTPAKIAERQAERKRHDP